MQFLASCSLDESRKYEGKLVIPNADASKKGDKVFLNIVVEGSPVEVFKEGKKDNVKCITCFESPKFCPTEWRGNVFREYSFDDFNVNVKEIEGVVPLLRLPDGFCNMFTLYSIMSERPDVRFIGGNILQLPGMKVGRYDEGKEKMSSVFNEVYDSFLEIKLSDLNNLQEVVSKVKRRNLKLTLEDGEKIPKKKKKSGEKKPSPKKKQLKAYSSLFGEESVSF